MSYTFNVFIGISFRMYIPGLAPFVPSIFEKEGEFWFCRHEFIKESLDRLFNDLENENKLKSTTIQEFGLRAAFYLTELNAIHPFREGNGRTQREFIRELGLFVGFDIDWTRVTRQEMYAASVAGFRKGNSKAMGELLFRITSPSK